ncbi:peptidoglycan DD-metalloendopeptidase family protein [Niveibacterium terrae]|uniref:peptidoglycan DD-metalloendopeptidase family protein n=1 Tax=Niveibacterium terrae TaxID=3373598 RepID=UPI003A8FD500
MKGFTSPLLLLLMLAACSTATRAPVEERSTGAARPNASQDARAAEPAPVARPGHYIVKKGDTLISISLEHGQDWRDIAGWNKLDNPNLILVGQELRVVPPEGVSARPVLETRPIDARPVRAEPPAHGEEGLKREPRGGKVAYSDQALAAAIKAEAGTGPKVAVSEARPENKVAEPPKSPAASEPRGDADIDWAWPVPGKIVGTFNDASNKGLDIAGTLGEAVHAAGAGKIVYVGAGLRGYGNLVIIKHDAMFLSAYAHNQKILVKEGQVVKKGQEIAILGDSDSDRAKLHFEIRRQGKPVDPLRYLPKR